MSFLRVRGCRWPNLNFSSRLEYRLYQPDKRKEMRKTSGVIRRIKITLRVLVARECTTIVALLVGYSIIIAQLRTQTAAQNKKTVSMIQVICVFFMSCYVIARPYSVRWLIVSLSKKKRKRRRCLFSLLRILRLPSCQCTIQLILWRWSYTNCTCRSHENLSAVQVALTARNTVSEAPRPQSLLRYFCIYSPCMYEMTILLPCAMCCGSEYSKDVTVLWGCGYNSHRAFLCLRQ